MIDIKTIKKKLPPGETLWQSIYNESLELIACVTSDTLRQKYTHWSVKNGKLVKGSTASSPSLLRKQS